MIHQWRLQSPRQVSISLWKVVGALVNPKGILLHLQKPNSPTVNAVKGLLSSSISTWQYPNFGSSVENYRDPCRLSRVSSIWGKKYASLMDQLFRFLRSIQNLRLLSFWSRITVVTHGLCNLSDGTNVQHLLEVGLHVILHMRRYALVMLLEGCPICYLNFMFN